MNGMIDGTIITRSDIVKRKFDYPDVQVSLVNWSDVDRRFQAARAGQPIRPGSAPLG